MPRPMVWLTVVGWLGSISGLVGSALLAVNTPFSGYGFLAFLFSNACWFTHGIVTRTWPLVAMQLGFTATSLVGVYRWLMQ